MTASERGVMSTLISLASKTKHTTWVAAKELKLSYPIMENQMEKKMENGVETGGK